VHPALSIIAFTVLSGLGYGWVMVSIVLDRLGLTPFASDGHRLGVGLAAAAVITAGLLCSTGHLANPRNAWRALTRVRTSWLSREALLALLFVPVFGAYLFLAWRDPGSAALAWLGAASVVLAAATVLCTAMIYACLRTIRQWRTPLTPLNFMAISLALGALCHLLVTSVSVAPVVGAGNTVTLVLVLVAFAGKLAYFLSMGLPAGQSIGIATGFRMATVRLLDVGHTSGTFLTDEFGYRTSRAALLALRLLTLLFGFVLPALVVARSGAPLAVALALLMAVAGALVERWLFFAEAQHVVRLYHGQTVT
jgi:DMSO reductase anchor subunit